MFDREPDGRMTTFEAKVKLYATATGGFQTDRRGNKQHGGASPRPFDQDHLDAVNASNRKESRR